MKSKNLFTIKFVSDQTGLKPHVIRAWESRYDAVVPKRTHTNRRLYCQKDIGRLKLLKKAIDAGHQISQIAASSSDELRQILDLTDDTAKKTPPAADEKSRKARADEDYHQTCLQAVVEMNPEKLDRALSDAAIELTRKKWVEDVVVPLFKRIGDLWSSGRLKIVNEHVASNCARTIMWDMLRTVEIAPTAPRIVVGTPVGQWHELGALSVALAAAEAGWRPMYVGPNLPAEELASAVRQSNARGIGLSISHPMNDTRLQPELQKLRRYIGKDCVILIGGLQGAGWEAVAKGIQAKRLDSWQAVIEVLGTISIS